MKGQLLCDVAYYEHALQALDQAVRLGLSEAWIFLEKGWALENLGVDRARVALQAYEDALGLEPDDLTLLLLHMRRGDALHLLGEVEQAAHEYELVIEQARKLAEELDADALSFMGWCHYRLREYDEAVRLFIDALSLNKGMISTQFDLALTLMCKGRYSRALRENRFALELAQGKHVLLRHGLLHIALRDLKQAVAEQRELTKVEEVQMSLQLLEEALKETSKKATAFTPDMR
jgi:tetratricopeptide (TPR) repeat protein